MSALDIFNYSGQQVRTGEGHIYVVAFGNGIVKVGFTMNPNSRIKAHIRHGRSLNVPVENIWVSGPHKQAAKNERDLIDAVASMVGRVSGQAGEFFTADYSRTLALAKRLPMTRAGVSGSAPDEQRPSVTDWSPRIPFGEPELVPTTEQFGEWAEIVPRNYAEALTLCSQLAREVEVLRRVFNY